MNTHRIKCKNDHCDKALNVEHIDGSEPILFCSQVCLNSYLSENQILNPNLNYEDPKEVRMVVKNLLTQTKRLQNEIEDLRKVRKTYFGLFKDYVLKDEVYKRKWTFEDEANE